MSNFLIYKWQFQKSTFRHPKKHIRKNIWKGKGYWIALKAFSLAKSLSTRNSKKNLYAKPK